MSAGTDCTKRVMATASSLIFLLIELTVTKTAVTRTTAPFRKVITMSDLIWFKFRTDWIKVFKTLSKPETDRLFDAIEANINDTEMPELIGREALVWMLIGAVLDEDKKARQKAAEAHRIAGELGGRPKTKMVIDETKKTKMVIEKPNGFEENQNNQNAPLRVKSKELRDKSEEERDITPAPAKPTKHRHGNFGHVFLTDEDLQKLQERFPMDYQQRIQNLDDYLENNPSKHYANHYLTILTWARKDEQKKPAQVRQPEPYKSTYQRLKEMGEI